MEDVLHLATDYELIKDDLINREDEIIISKYLKPIVVDGASWSQSWEDEDMFNKIPSELFDAQSHNFEIVKPRTEACGKTDGCESGCWRIMGRDKLIKSEKNGKILGFKKILKFCKKTKLRECNRSWAMEEYRLPKKWNWKQDQVLWKIQLMFETEISFLLAKHFSYLYTTSVPNKLLPEYGDYVPNLRDEEGVFYLQTINNCAGHYWSSYVTNDVYRLHPMTLVDALDPIFLDYGSCFFANRTKACGRTDGCYQEGGCWRIVDRDRPIKSKTGKILGLMRVFNFCEKENQRYVCEGEDVNVTWTIEEYRLVKKAMRDKVLCVIKVDVF